VNVSYQTVAFVGYLLGLTYANVMQCSQLQFFGWLSHVHVVLNMVQLPFHDQEPYYQFFDFHASYCPISQVLRMIEVTQHVHQKYYG